MTENECREIIEELDAIRCLRWGLQLHDWKVHVTYERLGVKEDDSRVAGTCVADPRYMEASIKIDPEHIGSKEELLFTLRHELLHLALAPTEVYRQQVGELATDKEFELLEISYSLGVEQSIWNIQRLLDHGLGMTPIKMIQKVRRENRS